MCHAACRGKNTRLLWWWQIINAKNPYSTITLDRLLGLYSECNATDLPKGASPRTINCDFIIGSVNPRPGKRSAFIYEDFFVERICGFADSVADAANEQPWDNPINATKDITGVYASVPLHQTLPLTNGLVEFYATNGTNGDLQDTIALPPLTPDAAGDWAVSDALGNINGNSFGLTPDDAAWQGANAFAGWFGRLTPDTTPLGLSGTFTSSVYWSGAAALAKVVGGIPVPVQASLHGTGGNGTTGTFGNPISADSCLVAFLECGFHTKLGSGFAIQDDVNGPWTNIVFSSNASEPSGAPAGTLAPAQGIWIMPNPTAGATTTVSMTTSSGAGASYAFVELPIGSFGGPTQDISEQLRAFNFGYSLAPTLGILGFQVEVTGKQTSADPNALLTLKLLNPNPDSPTRVFQLPSVEGTITFGLPTDTWDLALTPELLNDPNFGVKIQGASPDAAVTFDISAVKLKVYITPQPPPSFNYLKSYEQDAGEITNLALDSNGILWGEDAVNLPGVLQELKSNIEPDSFAQSVTQDDREFIAISNLMNGTDVPYSYNGTGANGFARLSQVGPGAGPSCSTSQNGAAITSITQNPAVPLITGSHDWLLVSASPQDIGNFGEPATPGNVMTIIFASARTVPSYMTPGTNIVLAGFPTINGNRVNNDPAGVLAPKYYTIVSTGTAIPGQQSYDAITFIVPFNTFFNAVTPGGCTIQSTLATMKTPAQIPNLEVGSQFAVSGASQAGYDNTWMVLQTPNASQMEITDTSLTNNVATYAFNLVSGTAPVPGQFVTVAQTLNGNGIFNVAKAVISSVTATTFSIGIVSPNITGAAEQGTGIVFGTIFVFDAFAIIGNSTGGNVVTTGIIGAGIRKCCVSFETANGYVTQPSPIATFNVVEGASGIAVANIPTGPSNVIRRHLHFTGANGGNFFDIPQPVSVVDPSTGATTVYTSTWINDNTTRNVTLSFPDSVLLEGLAVDVQGTNLFETPEAGSMIAIINYATRLFLVGEQNKLTNLLNYSFDGGFGTIGGNTSAGGGAGSANSTYPLGWIVDQTFGGGGKVINSPIFGFAYQISNTTGSTQSLLGMITQGAFQDEFQVPIIQPSTTYSARITASASPGSAGFLTAQLWSPALNKSLGTADVDLSSLSTVSSIVTLPILNVVVAPVPNDLQLRLFADQITDGSVVTVDRIEIFPTEEPVLSTQVTASYVNDFEAFDQIDGVIDTASENPQPVRNGFVYFDTLYLVKTRSLVATDITSDLPPVKWPLRTVSQRCGTKSIYGVDSGEDWAVIAGQPGLFYFSGGQPIGITREIQRLWNLINWEFEHTLWVKNDVINQRILIGVPMRTYTLDAQGNRVQNPWIPAGVIPDNPNPTTPNVVIDLNYKQVNTGVELADRAGVRVSPYSGQLLTTDASRKFSVWTVKAPCAAFLTQADGSYPLFVGNSDGTGKIYELDETLHQDDGSAIHQIYTTYGFVNTEEEAQSPVGSVRKLYDMMTLLLDGEGSLRMTAMPNDVDSDYSHPLLPDIVLPGAPQGQETEIPVNETGQQLFMQFETNAVDEWFSISRMKMMMSADPWAAIRGSN